MLCPVCRHQFLHTLEQFFAVIGSIHIYEINNNDSSQVPKTHLPCQFFCHYHIHFKGIVFLTVSHL